LAVLHEGCYHGLLSTFDEYPGDLVALLGAGGNALSDAATKLRRGNRIDLSSSRGPAANWRAAQDHLHRVELRPIIPRKAVSSLKVSDRICPLCKLTDRNTALTMIVAARLRDLDYEGGARRDHRCRRARHSRGRRARARCRICNFSTTARIRDFQHKTPQWTVGKNFDGTGAFGPEFVTADELPPGAKGLMLQTRLNGKVVQRASTDEMISALPIWFAF